MVPFTRIEKYMSAIAEGEGTIPKKPFTREEKYLDGICKKLNKENATLPLKPLTRIEKYLANIYENIGSGGCPRGIGDGLFEYEKYFDEFAYIGSVTLKE